MNQLPLLDPARHGWGGDEFGPESILVGPPGTGKTRAVLDVFLRPAVAAEPETEDVLACSYTRAASYEMRDRLRAATSCTERASKATCRTIHSEAYRLARMAASSGVQVIDGTRAAKLLRSPLAALAPPARRQTALDDSAESDDDLRDLAEALYSSPLDGISGERDEAQGEALRLWERARHTQPAAYLWPPLGSTPAAYDAMLARAYMGGRWPLDELQAHVRAYERLKFETGMLDFTDLLKVALVEGPLPHRRLLVVDEAQDCSPLQLALVEHWASAADHLVLVGDPDQGIYSFAGADGEHLYERIRRGVRASRLGQSWRVPRLVHEQARDLVLLTRDRVDAPYEPADRDGQLVECEDPDDALAAALAGEPTSTLILARAGRGLAPYAAALAGAGVPYRHERGSSPWEAPAQREFMLAVSALVAGRPLLGAEARRLIDEIPGRPKGWFAATKKAAQAWAKEQAEIKTIGLTAERIEEASGAGVTRLRSAGTVEAALRMIGQEHEGLCRILARGGEQALREEPRIALTTIHGAKGREADSVLLDLEAPWPCVQDVARHGPEGERRVVYVGLTRARYRLVLRRQPGESRDLGRLVGLDGRSGASISAAYSSSSRLMSWQSRQ